MEERETLIEVAPGMKRDQPDWSIAFPTWTGFVEIKVERQNLKVFFKGGKFDKVEVTETIRKGE